MKRFEYFLIRVGIGFSMFIVLLQASYFFGDFILKLRKK